MPIHCLHRVFLPALLAVLAMAGCGTPRTAPPTTLITERPAPSLQATIEATRMPSPPAIQTAHTLPTPTTIATIQPHAAEQTAMPQQEAWAQARSALPAEVPIYKPAFIPSRFDSPQLLEARTDQELGVVYTIVYSAPDESLAFILNMGKGAFGNFPPSEMNESIRVLGVKGELSISTEAHALGAFWQDRGQNYQIKAFSKTMTKDELLQITSSLSAVEPSKP